MGNTESKQPIWHSTCYELPLAQENLTFIKSRNDALLGNLDELVHKSNNESLLKKEILINDQSALTEDALHRLKQRVHLTNENLLKIYGFALNVSNEGTSKIDIFFEPFASSAAIEFGVRQKEKSPFEEEELYTTIIAVAQTLALLQDHKISHGHMTPEAILMSRDGDIKLLDHSLVHKENSAYVACLEGAKSPYIAPELLNLLRENSAITSDVNLYKADVFSLGMTFLYGALLEEPTNCYNWETREFNEAALAEKIKQVQAKYPGRFSNILAQILAVNPAERPDPVTLLTKITYYENSQFAKGTSQYATGSYSSSQYTFVDPRVQEIIREAKEKNWIKSYTTQSNTSPVYYSQQLAETNRTAALTRSEGKYQSPFLDRYSEYLSKTQFISKQLTPETEITHLDTSKLIFNRPEVNEVIENVIGLRKSGVIEKKEWSSPLLQSAYIESYAKQHFVNEEKLAGSCCLQSFESPQKKSYNQLVRESDGYAWGSGVKTTANETTTVNVSVMKSPRKIQTKEEIIKELRSKYGSHKGEAESKEMEKVKLSSIDE